MPRVMRSANGAQPPPPSTSANANPKPINGKRKASDDNDENPTTTTTTTTKKRPGRPKANASKVASVPPTKKAKLVPSKSTTTTKSRPKPISSKRKGSDDSVASDDSASNRPTKKPRTKMTVAAANGTAVKPTTTKKATTAKTTAAKSKSTTPKAAANKAKGAKQSKAPAKAAKPTKSRDLSPPALAVINAVPVIELQVYVFGEGGSGELGLGVKDSTEVKAPRPNPYLVDVVDITTGGMHAAAVTAQNQIVTWGINDDSTLGRDTTWDGKDDDDDDTGLNPHEATPAAVRPGSFPPGTRFFQVAAGDSTTFALTDTGLVYGLGTFRDHNGSYGFTFDTKTGEKINPQRDFMLIPGLKDVTSLSVGSDFALALDVKGKVWGWGNSQQDQLGHKIFDHNRPKALNPAPIRLPGRSKFVSIHAGANHAFAIDTKGDTWAWGLNNFGQTGITGGAGTGDATVPTPKKVPSLAGKKMKMISGGNHHSIGVTDSGECLVWGRLDGGQLGLDISTLPTNDPGMIVCDDRNKPRILLVPTALAVRDVAHCASGPEHNVIVTKEGRSYSWGFNANYQCGIPVDDDIPEPRLMKGRHIREKELVWAGAGGQYGMVASHADGGMAPSGSTTTGSRTSRRTTRVQVNGGKSSGGATPRGSNGAKSSDGNVHGNSANGGDDNGGNPSNGTAQPTANDGNGQPTANPLKQASDADDAIDMDAVEDVDESDDEDEDDEWKFCKTALKGAKLNYMNP